MRLNFRQGLVTYQKDLHGQPKYLSAANSPANFVTLVVAPTPLTITFAHGTTDYLATFDTTVESAWGPLVPGVDNWLYWEMDPITAKVHQGITTLQPVFNSLEPARIQDQSWFDTSTTKMRVWQAQSQKWVERIRVFAGKAIGGSNREMTMYSYGSQVNLNTDSTPGYVMLDSQLRPLRTSLGELVTTGSDVRIKNTIGTAGVLALPTNAYIPVMAGEAIPAMSLVYFSAADTVSLASSDPALITKRTPVGIVQEALAQNEVGILTQIGDVVYDQWDWTGHIGQAVYTDSVGRITTNRPAGLMAYRVGFIKNKNTIIFGIDAETEPQVYQAAESHLIVNGLSPIITTDTINPIGERVVNVSIQPAIANYQDGYMTAAQAQQVNNVAAQMASVNQKILDLDAGKANLVHTHTIAQVDGLQAALNSKFPIDGNFDNRYSLLSHNHDGRYAFLVHTHPISEIDGLPARLLTKMERATGLISFNRVFTNVDSTGSVDIGTGENLIQALEGKANSVHTHSIVQVIGLQSALDGKANTIHIHTIDQVVGLQIALDGKANVLHTHTIAQVDGLQSVLNGKSDVGHLHSISDVTGLEGELTGLSAQINNKTLISLTDVAVTAPTPGQSLLWNGSKWANGTPAPGIKVYSNETTSYFTNGMMVRGTDGSIIVTATNQTVPNGDNVTTIDLSASLRKLTDVEVDLSLALGQVLTWNGTKWVNKAMSTGSVSLRELTDVNLGDVADNSVLAYNSLSSMWRSIELTLGTLTDVSLGTPETGETLVYDTPSGAFLNRQLTLPELAGVSLTNLSVGQTLTYNGSNWINQTPSTGVTRFANLEDVSLTTLGSGQVITWNGSRFTNTSPSALNGITLAQLSDVSVGSQVIGSLLGWNGTSWSPRPSVIGLPAGGTTGQMLVKRTNGDGDTQWANSPIGLPAGGSVGQVLSKTSNVIDGASEWVTAPTGVPLGGQTGQVLTKPNDQASSALWMAAPIGMPAGGQGGQVLVKNTNATGDASWQMIPRNTNTTYMFQTHADAADSITRGELLEDMWVEVFADETRGGFGTLYMVANSALTFMRFVETAAYVGYAPAEIPTNSMLGMMAFADAVGSTQVYLHAPISQPGDVWREYVSDTETLLKFHGLDGVIRTKTESWT